MPNRTISVSGGLGMLQMVSELDIEQCKDVGPQGRQIVRSQISQRGEWNIPYKGVKTSPYQRRFKTVKLTMIRNGPKQTRAPKLCTYGLD